MSEEEICKFYEEFRSEVIDFASGGDGHESDGFKENAFTRIVAEDLSAAGIVEAPDICYIEFGPANRRAKANGCSIPEDDSRLDIFLSLYHGGTAPSKVNKKDIDRVFGQGERFVDASFNGQHERMEPGSEPCAMVREISEAKAGVDRVRLILITDGVVVSRKELERDATKDGFTLTHEIWDLERLRRFRSSGSTHESLEVDFRTLPEGGLPCIRTGDGGLGYETSVAIIPGGSCTTSTIPTASGYWN